MAVLGSDKLPVKFLSTWMICNARGVSFVSLLAASLAVTERTASTLKMLE